MNFQSNIEEQYETYTKADLWGQVFTFFEKISYERSLSKKTSVAKKIINSKLNRYSNVIPFDETRVKLNKLDNDYINASLVKIDKAERNYILTQGPLKNTVSHFWLMVWEQNSRAIVMLNKLNENGVDKCFLYWPTKNKNLMLSDVDLEVEMILEKEDDRNCDFIIREFRLKNIKEGTARTIFQFHTLFWPDFNVPKSPESFVEFLYTVKQSGLLNSNKYGPAIIHCSAGIGRSGTFVVVDSYLSLLKKSIKQNKPEELPSIPDLLLKMRSYRLGLVQTSSQLKFAYEAIINAKKSKFFEQEEEPDENLLNHSERELNLSNDSFPDCYQVNDKRQDNEKELRRRTREEKKKSTMDHIQRIRSKQKEIEDWNKKQKIIKYVGIIFVTIFVGSLYYKTTIN